MCHRGPVCSYIRALIKEKCLDLHVGTVKETDDMSKSLKGGDAIDDQAGEQVWVQSEKILDNILSCETFERQSTTLRLVCKSFKATAIRQLEARLLDQTWPPIAFDGCHAGVLRADARRGWSQDMTCRESTVDDVLWLASCRSLVCTARKAARLLGKPHLSLRGTQQNNWTWRKLVLSFPNKGGSI